MNRRHAHTRPTPARTGGDDRDRLPCDTPLGMETFDALTDRAYPEPDYINAARNMCATCLLTNPDTARACLDAAKGGQWRRHVLAKPRPEPKPQVGAWAAFNANRLDDLRRCVREGLTSNEAAARLGVTRNGLWNWAKRHGHQGLYAQLRTDERRGNQYRQTALGTVATRRKKVAA